MKALEQRVGQSSLSAKSPAGQQQPECRCCGWRRRLESEALAETGGGSAERTRIAIAVNADSMSTWFTAVLGQLPDVLVDIRIEDRCGASAVAGTLTPTLPRTKADTCAGRGRRRRAGPKSAQRPRDNRLYSVSPNTPAQAAAAVAVDRLARKSLAGAAVGTWPSVRVSPGEATRFPTSPRHRADDSRCLVRSMARVDVVQSQAARASWLPSWSVIVTSHSCWVRP